MTAGRLTGLLTKVEDLPGKQARATLVTRLKFFEQKLAVVESVLVDAQANEAFVAEVFPGELPGDQVPGVEELATRAAKEAKRLRKKLSEKIDFIADTKANELLIRIVESAHGARDAVTAEWKKRVSSRVSALRPIAKLAKDAGLPGADGIATRLQAIEKFQVPRSSADAEQIRSEFAAVANNVKRMPSGAAWEFLGKAIDGQARARDLENPEVRAFIDAQHLWDRLTVRLG